MFQDCRKNMRYCAYIWASTRENLSSGVCEQQKRRPACASGQTDQRLCYWLIGKYHILTCYRREFNFLASLCSLAGWFESHHVRNPEDRFSRNEAHLRVQESQSMLLCCFLIKYHLLLYFFYHLEIQFNLFGIYFNSLISFLDVRLGHLGIHYLDIIKVSQSKR